MSAPPIWDAVVPWSGRPGSLPPAPPLWVRWCMGCEARPVEERGYNGLAHRMRTSRGPLVLPDEMGGYGPWERVG